MTTPWVKFDRNNIPKQGKPYLVTDGKNVELNPWPSDEWGLFGGGIRKISDVTHYAEVNLPMKYLVIVNLMGGVAWILHEFDDEQSANEKYKEMSDKASHNDFQLLVSDTETLKKDIDAGTLQYL
jgi:hypothetical protein